jgi:hypothetical protein
MTKKAPFYSTKEDLYHDNDKCAVGKKIPDYSQVPGSGGKDLCATCATLDAAGQ